LRRSPSSASGGLTIALDALGGTYLRLAADLNIDPAVMVRIVGALIALVAVIGL
jgi:hypothetical protein